MRKIMALITAVAVLCVGCGKPGEGAQPDTRGVSAAVANWVDSGGWTGESLERQRRLVRWYNLNLQSECPESGFRECYHSILAGPGGLIGWGEFPDTGAVLPLLQDGSAGAGFLHRQDTPIPNGEGGVSVLRLSSRQQMLWLSWRAPEPGDVFRIHILDLVLTYRIQAPTADEALPEESCLLLFPWKGEDFAIQGILVES